MSFIIAAQDKSHDRKGFDFGADALNVYLIRQASQDIRRKVAACFVTIDNGSSRLAGYDTLSAASVPLTHLPDEATHKLPRYWSIPAARLGR